MIYKLYTGTDYLPKYEADDVIAQLAVHSELTIDPAKADLFVFPVNYEKLYGYTEHEYQHFDYRPEEIENLKAKLSEMVELANFHQKNIVLLYYYDPVKKIIEPNAIIFRTSLLKSKKDKNEFAMPAYGKDLRTILPPENNEFWLPKTAKPSVGFRGQSAPIKLPAKLAVKRKLNQLFKTAGLSKQFNLHYNFGYLARRDAIFSCQNSKLLSTDITLTSLEQSWDPVNGKIPFVKNVYQNQYNICVSGHGNYSFRLYEIMSAGRIPVFINTDCVLPFEEFINWKKHVVWIEEKEAKKTDQHVLAFHDAIHPDDFLQLQKDNRELWEKYLSKQGFFKNLNLYFPLLPLANHTDIKETI